MSIRFDDKVVIVTGAGGGLGRSHALEFARRGAKVAVNDFGGSVDGSGGSSDVADAVVREIEDAGGEAIANGSSVTDEAGVKTLVGRTMDRFGRIDVLVNNAGILRDKSFQNMRMEDFNAAVEVHLAGTAMVTNAVWPIMREQAYGRVLVTSSSSGLYGNFGQANYGAAKMGVVGLVNTLKIEGRKYNICCNALAPVAYTRMTSDLMPSEAESLMAPERVTPAVIFLCGEDAPTGAIVAAGAGAFAKVEVVESHGAFLGHEPTAEDVANNWDNIKDMSESKSFFMGSAQTDKFFEMVSNNSQS